MEEKLRELERVIESYIDVFDQLKKENSVLKKDISKLKQEKKDIEKRENENLSRLKDKIINKIGAISKKIEDYIKKEEENG